MVNVAADYLIWSNEYGKWWAPNSMGYVDDVWDAGRYTRDRALLICASAPRRWRRLGGWLPDNPPPELPVRVVDAYVVFRAASTEKA